MLGQEVDGGGILQLGARRGLLGGSLQGARTRAGGERRPGGCSAASTWTGRSEPWRERRSLSPTVRGGLMPLGGPLCRDGILSMGFNLGHGHQHPLEGAPILRDQALSAVFFSDGKSHIFVIPCAIPRRADHWLCWPSGMSLAGRPGIASAVGAVAQGSHSALRHKIA